MYQKKEQHLMFWKMKIQIPSDALLSSEFKKQVIQLKKWLYKNNLMMQLSNVTSSLGSKHPVSDQTDGFVRLDVAILHS